MKNFFERIPSLKKAAKGALIGAVLLSPGAKLGAQELSTAKTTTQTENERHDKDILAGIENMESRYKSATNKEIKSDKPAYVIISESELLNSNSQQQDSLMSDRYIVENLLSDVVNEHSSVSFLARGGVVVDALQRENNFQNDGLVALGEIKDHGYLRPDAYVVIEQKVVGDVLTFSANIIPLDTKQSERVSVSGSSLQASISPELQNDLLNKLKKLVQEKISLGNTIK